MTTLEWKVGNGAMPEDTREKLLKEIRNIRSSENRTTDFIFPEVFISQIEVCVSSFTDQERKQTLKNSLYDDVKRDKGVKNPPTLSAHTGEELEEILKTTKGAYEAIFGAKMRAQDLLEQELRDRAGDRHNSEEFHLLPINYNELNKTLQMLSRIIEAIEPAGGLLSKEGRGRRSEPHRADLVRGLGYQLRLALGRVPTHGEITWFIEEIFPNETFSGYIKNWQTEARKTPFESEKYDKML